MLAILKKHMMNYLDKIQQELVLLEKEFWKNRRSNVNPSIFQHDYLYHLALYRDIKNSFSEIRRKSKIKKFRIIDVGCGDKPYLRLFHGYAKKYIGVDIMDSADVIAPAEKLPLKNEKFDLALCFQVLEHSENPDKVVSEMKRVLAKGGYMIATTHGIWNYHPFPHDYYRWTHEGLEKLFERFSQVKARANLNSYSSVLQIINIELYSLACRKVFLKLPLYSLITIINLFGKFLIPYGKKHLAVNYIIVGKAD